GWNGQDNDDEVNVVLSHSDIAQTHTMDGGLDSPRWDGNDVWRAWETDFLNGNPSRPFIYDDRAYVVERQLVARLPDRSLISLRTDQAELALRLSNLVLTARLSNNPLWLENVNLSGEWLLVDVVDALPKFGICQGAMNYDHIARVLDDLADLYSREPEG